MAYTKLSLGTIINQMPISAIERLNGIEEVRGSNPLGSTFQVSVNQQVAHT